ncbi:MAG: rhodanese-like domain-containing protein [Saprospiraceae bacterium]|nr:rhodanese-like domain-containing protein [Saprospiraceae bacterium]
MKLRWLLTMMNLFGTFDIRDAMRSGAVIVDVRTEAEYVGFHIKGAFNIPYDEIEKSIETIQSWHKPIIVYSTYGLRGRLAAKKLRKYGIAVWPSTRDQLCELLAST